MTHPLVHSVPQRVDADVESNTECKGPSEDAGDEHTCTKVHVIESGKQQTVD